MNWSIVFAVMGAFLSFGAALFCISAIEARGKDEYIVRISAASVLAVLAALSFGASVA